MISLSKLARLATAVVWQFYPRAGLRIVLNWFWQIETKWKEILKIFAVMTKNNRPKNIWQALHIQILLRKRDIQGEGYNIVNVTSLFCKGIPMVPLQPEELLIYVCLRLLFPETAYAKCYSMESMVQLQM